MTIYQNPMTSYPEGFGAVLRPAFFLTPQVAYSIDRPTGFILYYGHKTLIPNIRSNTRYTEILYRRGFSFYSMLPASSLRLFFLTATPYNASGSMISRFLLPPRRPNRADKLDHRLLRQDCSKNTPFID